MDAESNKSNKKRIIYVLLTAVTVIVILSLLFVFVFSGKKSYRTIKVVDMENSSVVNRNGVGEFETFLGMLLENGDHVDTLSQGKLFLELDGDKHIVAEPKTIFDIELAGKTDLKDAKTKIVLTEGAINSVIEKPLMDNESYEIETPTGVMGVRGTEFLTITGTTEGEKYAEVQVTKGAVEIYRPNDEKAGSVTVEAGKMLIVKESDVLLSELVPWEIGKEPPVDDEVIVENEEEEADNYDFGFSFEDFKFDGKTLDANTFTTIINDYNVNKPVAAGAGEAFSSDDGNIMVFYQDEQPTHRYISWKTTGTSWETLAIHETENNSIAFTCDSTFQEAELRTHYSSPIKEGISRESLLETLNIPEEILNGEMFKCSLSDKDCYAYQDEGSGSITIAETGNERRVLDIRVKDGVVTGFRISFRFE